MFGELIGLWAAEVWSSMGSPNPVRLIELGPGRGTLMSDALRAARIVPEFRAALDVWLIETSPTLAAMQHELLLDAGVAIAWAQTLKETPEGPAIVIGNEFLDALPVRQFVRVGGQWRERVVGSTTRAVLPSTSPPSPSPTSAAPRGTARCSRSTLPVIASCSNSAAGSCRQGGAALLIDYGHAVTGFGDTLQALRAPSLCRSARRCPASAISPRMSISPPWRAAPRATGAAVYGPIDQGDFLRAIGIDLRTKALAERARAGAGEELEQARNRLVGKGKGEMGALFKAMAVANRSSAAPARASSLHAARTA